MKKTALIMILLAILAASISCTKQDKEATIITQETSIDNFINKQYSDSTIVRRNGSNRIMIIKSDAKDSLVFGDSVYFYYAGYLFSNGFGTLFNTNDQGVAEAAGFALTDPDYSVKKVRYQDGSFISGLTNGMYGLKEGEQCIIVFSAKYGFYDTQVYNIPKLSPLIYQIAVTKVIKAN